MNIMSASLNYTSVYQTMSNINDIKFDPEENKIEETVSLFIPHHTSESTTFEDEFDSSQMIKNPLDVNYDDVETDPLAFEETNFIKSENLKIKNELEIDTEQLKDNTFIVGCSNFPTEMIKTVDVKIKNERTQELDISLDVETVAQVNDDNVKIEELDIDDEYLQKVKTEEVELPSHDEETIQERTENCLSEHINGDVNEKKYNCNFCSKSYNNNCTLQLHLKKHTEDS
ncbi:uncharacterized protein LOC142333745 isoform X4 [Lycorma delicatula]|uniref:uncharacterized protein LOC142333745 isoform X4 n=1 Tax=Lycorma delicatula TaxID=130591 RepID=UPI003F5166F6